MRMQNEIDGKVITDELCDTVYISSYLGKNTSEDTYPGVVDVYSELKKILEKHKIPLKELCNTADIWARDFMPVQITRNHYWGYKYNPDYLPGEESKYITDFRDVTCRGQKLFPALEPVSVVADGGNVVKCDDFVILTDKVFTAPENIENRLSWIDLCKSIGVEAVIIPREKDPEEKLGHADGMMHYAGNNRVILRAPQSPEDHLFLNNVKEQFRSQKPNVEVLQFDFSEVPYSRQCPANWAYINFLRVGNVIVLPSLSTPGQTVMEDEIAKRQLQKWLPECSRNIEQIPMRDFIEAGGGALNCITWTVREN